MTSRCCRAVAERACLADLDAPASPRFDGVKGQGGDGIQTAPALPQLAARQGFIFFFLLTNY